MSTISDGTMGVIYSAMRGLAQRQRVTSNNVANVQTPGYHAERVDFESSLRSAVANGSADNVTPTITKTSDPERMDGNNVSLDDETITQIKTNLQYQTMVEAMNAKYRLLKTAIGA